jgi:hypothetical protein
MLRTMAGAQARSRAERYVEAIIDTLGDVVRERSVEEAAELLEIADFFFRLGVGVGTRRPDEAMKILSLAQVEKGESADLSAEADAFCRLVLGRQRLDHGA